MSDRVTFDVEDGVGVVTLERPEKLNAMDAAMFEGLHEAAARAEDAARAGRCRAVLVRGAGRAFSAGLDVTLFGEQAAGAAPDDARIAWLQQAFTAYEDLPVPTVAAIRGAALGAGCQLALACSLRVVADDASIGVLEARWGLVPDLGGTYRLPRLIGLGRATDLCTSGRTIDAGTALAWGFANDVLPVDGFEGAVHDRVAQLARGATVAIGAVPRLLRDALDSDRATALAEERRQQARCLASADFREAALAAVQGRPPAFGGR